MKTQRTYEATFKRISGDAMPCDFENEIYKQTQAKYFDNQKISKDVIRFAMLLKNYNDFSGYDEIDILSEYSLLNKNEINQAIELKEKISEWTYKIFIEKL